MPILRRNRPEPFKPYDPHLDRPRWRLWVVAGTAVIATAGVVIAMSDSPPELPVAPPAMRAAAEAQSAIDTAPPEAAPVQDVQPVPSPTTSPEPAAEAAPQAPPTLREGITTARANIRSAPSMAGALVWTAPRGTRLDIFEEEGSWLRVSTPEGDRRGWMHNSLVAE